MYIKLGSRTGKDRPATLDPSICLLPSMHDVILAVHLMRFVEASNEMPKVPPREHG
jgi:hypothetical protein